MSAENRDRPVPEVDEEPPRAPGGPDSDLSESDVGAGSEGPPVTPDAPLSAQQDKAEVPDELQTPEEPDTTGGDAESSSAEPSA